jgi:flagellar protein FlbD
MIYVTRLDGTEVVVNTDLIVTIERTPDTVLTLVTGGRLLVKESVEEVVERSIGYRHRIFRGPGLRESAVEPAASPSAVRASAKEG